MRNHRFNREPLLYVNKSEDRTPKAYMQKEYDTLKEQARTNSNRPPGSSKRTRTVRGRSLHLSNAPFYKEKTDADKEKNHSYDVYEYDESESEEAHPPREKKFKDMNLEERVLYFANVPELSPKLRCKVQTGDRTFRGKIVDFVDDEVYMIVGKRIAPTKIPFEHISDIQLLGF